jgi:hypothetical protein
MIVIVDVYLSNWGWVFGESIECIAFRAFHKYKILRVF